MVRRLQEPYHTALSASSFCRRMWAASVRRAASAAKYAAAATTATLVTNDTNCFYETRKKIGAYDLGPTLGEGAFATVRKASKGGETYACKIINTARMNEELCTKEIEMMQRAGKHANLVSLIDVVELPDARALVLELATGGEVLRTHLREGLLFRERRCIGSKTSRPSAQTPAWERHCP